MAKYGIKDLFYDFSRITVLSFSPGIRIRRLPAGTKEEMKKTLRFKGGALIVGNHTGMTDPLAATIIFWRRRVSYIVAEVVFETSRAVDFLLSNVGCIKVDRNIFDFECVKKSIEVLKGGRPIIMFPEGGIRNGDESEFKSGAVLMAIRAKVPIIPIYLTPSRGVLHMRHAVIGEPIDVLKLCGTPVPSKEKLDEISKLLSDREEELKQIYENKYAKR